MNDTGRACVQRRTPARLGVGFWIAVLIVAGVGNAAPVRGQGEEEYRRVTELGMDALENRRLDEAISAFKRCLEVKPDDELCAYNLACAYSLKRDVRTALDWLTRSIEWGFDDVAHMQKDTDLDNLRGEARYVALVRKMEGAPDLGAVEGNTIMRTSELIVMIEGVLGDGPTIGAGIIFGRQGDQIYVATARHVVRRGDVAATDLQIRLKPSPEELLPARVTEHSDPTLDLAVLTATVPAAQAAQFCKSTPLEVLADANALQRGDGIYPVGYPNGAPWGMPVAPDRVAQLVGSDITFQSAFISGGHSGGAVITEEGTLAGMIKADTPPFGVAVHISRVLQMLRQWGYPVLLSTPSNFRTTPLHQAIEKRDLSEVRKLVDACAHVNTIDDSGRTPLHVSSALGSAEAVRLLLGAGADVSARTRGPGDSASIHSRTALHLAAAAGSAPVAQLLIAQGADVNAKALDFVDRDWGGTPLHEAAAAGAVDVIDVLIRARADIDAFSVNGSPLASAVRKRAGAAVKMLIARGAELQSGSGDVPLYIAADSGAEEITKLLLDGGADVNVDGAFGRRPLHQAARHGHLAIVRMLLAAKADPNVKSMDEQTPLHTAASEGRLESIKLLLAAGASPTARDRNGATPLDLAERGGHQPVVSLLRAQRN
jgi:ankyrin repeat protein